MLIEIGDDDQISRCIIYNRAFDLGIHVDKYLWPFGASGEDGASHESAVLRRLAPHANDVHRIGCKIAVSQNARKGDPPPGNDRRYYCGHRTAQYAMLPKKGDGYFILFSHCPEDGEDAHVDVALTITVQGRNPRATRRTAAGLELAEQFGTPNPFRCACDLGDACHPFDAFGSDCLTKGLTQHTSLIQTQISHPSGR